jgi:hypothetical protein
MQDSLDGEASAGLGASDGCEKELPGPERSAGAVAADEAEQSMLYGVPLRVLKVHND